MNIDVGTLVKEKVGELGEKKTEAISMRTRKVVLGSVQAVLVKKKLLIQFNDGQRIWMSYPFMLYLYSKEEVGK